MTLPSIAPVSPFALDKQLGLDRPSMLAGQSVDYITILGETSPGKCIIHNLRDDRGWDIRQGYANDGATIVNTGAKPRTWDITFEIWSGAQYAMWKYFAGKYFSRSLLTMPGGIAAFALAIYHPLLANPPIKIKRCVLAGGSPLLENDGFGLWSCTLSFIEWRPAKAIPAPKPLAAIPDVPPPQLNAEDATDPLNQAIQAKLDQALSLLAQ